MYSLNRLYTFVLSNRTHIVIKDNPFFCVFSAVIQLHEQRFFGAQNCPYETCIRERSLTIQLTKCPKTHTATTKETTQLFTAGCLALKKHARSSQDSLCRTCFVVFGREWQEKNLNRRSNIREFVFLAKSNKHGTHNLRIADKCFKLRNSAFFLAILCFSRRGGYRLLLLRLLLLSVSLYFSFTYSPAPLHCS